MHKRSLEFGFEGAFYKAWHITNKTYLGQKIDCITTKVDDATNTIVPCCNIDETINFDDFDVTSDTLVTKYLSTKHIKITGLKIVKRNTIKLAVMYYLKAIAAVLNNRFASTIEDDIVKDLLTELHSKFEEYPRLVLMEKKKVTVKFKATE